MISSRKQVTVHVVRYDPNVKSLDVEPKWHERGVREAIRIRMNNPTLNKETGRYNLPPVWNNTLKKLGRRGTPGLRISNQETYLPPVRLTMSQAPPHHLAGVWRSLQYASESLQGNAY